MLRPARRKAVLLATAAALVAVAVAALVLVLLRPWAGTKTDGPLVSDTVPQGSGFPLDARDGFSYAGITVWNSGPEPVILERVSLVDPEPGLGLLGALAAGRPAGAFIVAYRDYPPSRTQYPPGIVEYPRLAPLQGFVVPPQPNGRVDETTDTQIYVGLESTEPAGRVTLESFRIHYRAGEKSYELVVPHAVALCTPRAEYIAAKPCETFLPGDR